MNVKVIVSLTYITRGKSFSRLLPHQSRLLIVLFEGSLSFGKLIALPIKQSTLRWRTSTMPVASVNTQLCLIGHESIVSLLGRHIGPQALLRNQANAALFSRRLAILRIIAVERLLSFILLLLSQMQHVNDAEDFIHLEIIHLLQLLNVIIDIRQPTNGHRDIDLG